MTLCDETTLDINLLSTFWRCMPVPEQTVMHNLAQLALLSQPYVGVEQVKAMLFLAGGYPVNKRFGVMVDGLRLFIVEAPSPDCTAESPCVSLPLSVFIQQLAGNIANPFYQVGGVRCPPCYYEKVMP